jgi:hypothetical protein
MIVLGSTKSERVLLSDSLPGQAVRAYLDERSLSILPSNQLCRGVLLLPDDHDDYLRGHRRQALRTNLRRAAAAGIRCEVMTDRSGAFDEIMDVRHRRGESLDDAAVLELREALARPEITFMVARDESGRALAHAAVLIDDAVCLVVGAVAFGYDARWALHDYLVRTLIARRVDYLVATGGGIFGALSFTPGTQHYQHLLGYELRHLVPAKQQTSGRWARRLASAVGLTLAAGAFLLAPDAAAAAGIPFPLL